MVIIGKDGNIEHWEPNPRKANMPHFDLVNPRVEVPERLLPSVGYLPEACLVVIINTAHVHHQPLVDRYHEELKREFPHARFNEFPKAHTVAVAQERVQQLREARIAAVRDQVLQFVFYTGDKNRFVDQVADYTFYLRPGYVGLLIDLGKVRHPEPVERKHAVIYG